MFYRVPPAGTPTTIVDIMSAARRALLSRQAGNEFIAALRALSGAVKCYALNSGRASLSIVLRALAKMSSREKNEVVIPAYTCFTVAASVVNSGLRIRIVDIDPHTLDYDYAKLDEEDLSKVVAIVGCSLFGIANDWSRLQSIAKKSGCFLIDDAAQSLGKQTRFGMSGTAGDVGIFSFGRGKDLSTYSGGAIVTSDNRIAASIEEVLRTFPASGLDVVSLVSMTLYSLMLHPRLYWIPANLPFLGLGKTVFDPNFDITLLSPSRAGAGTTLLKKLAKFNLARKEHSKTLAVALLRMGGYEIPGYNESSSPAYLRLPVLCADKRTRDDAIAKLKRAGVSSSTMYPSTIRRIPDIEKYLAFPKDAPGETNNFPGAQAVVDRLLVLPTHPLLEDSDIERMVLALGEGK